MLCILMSLFSCRAYKPKTGEASELAMGTICSIRVYDGYNRNAVNQVFSRLNEITVTMSANDEGTVLDRLNRAAGIAAIQLPDDLFYVISSAIHYAELSNSAFNPAIGPLVKLWNIGMDDERIPLLSEIDEVLPFMDYHDIQIDGIARTAFLAKKGMALDLGAIVKGYAADQASSILKSGGVKAAIIDLGGNILVMGKKPDGKAWNVGVQNPYDSRGSYIGIIAAEPDTSIVTSGIYERYFLGDDGEHYHHILDGKTGYPIQNGLVSTTIVCASSIDADALSTTLFTMGLEDGMALAESLEGVEAIFIAEPRVVYLSSGLPKVFTLTDASFTLGQ